MDHLSLFFYITNIGVRALATLISITLTGASQLWIRKKYGDNSADYTDIIPLYNVYYIGLCAAMLLWAHTGFNFIGPPGICDMKKPHQTLRMIIACITPIIVNIILACISITLYLKLFTHTYYTDSDSMILFITRSFLFTLFLANAKGATANFIIPATFSALERIQRKIPHTTWSYSIAMLLMFLYSQHIIHAFNTILPKLHTYMTF
jgi:hypothetical protein